jgi:outer membrane protein, heavy metal efflux system
VYTRFKYIEKRTVLYLLTVLTLFWHATIVAETNDPVTGVETLSEKQLVEWVLERNPGLEELQAAVTEAASRVLPASSLDDPLLSFAFAPETINGFRRADGTTRGFNQRIELTQSIPWPGTLALREEQARSEVTAYDQILSDRRLQIIAAIKSGFAEWYYVHRALRINLENQALLLELRHVAEAQYAAGRASQQDALQADVEHAILQDQALALERERRSIQAQLNALINRAPHETLPPPDNLPPPSTLPASRDLQLIALTSHPVLKRIEANLNANEAAIGLAEKRYYPDFKLLAGYNSLWDESDKRLLFGASINLPLDRDKRNASLDAAKAAKMKTRWRLIDRRNQLLADQERSYAEILESIDVINLYSNRLVPLADENLSAAEADYRAGTGNFLNVITAEKQKLTTELRLQRAYANYLRRYAELERWTGGSLSMSDTKYLR